MVRRHYRKNHRFICITDDAEGISKDVEIVPLWNTFANIPSPHGPKNPSCYRRLKSFSPEFKEIVGERFVSLDLDCVILQDVSPLWDREEDFIIWGDTNPKTWYNGSMFMMTCGCRKQVWETFDPKTSPLKAMHAGKFGSDQGWISYVLGQGEKKWTTEDGVYSWRNHLSTMRGQVPENTRIVFFHGRHDPWDPDMQRVKWIKENWR